MATPRARLLDKLRQLVKDVPKLLSDNELLMLFDALGEFEVHLEICNQRRQVEADARVKEKAAQIKDKRTRADAAKMDRQRDTRLAKLRDAFMLQIQSAKDEAAPPAGMVRVLHPEIHELVDVHPQIGAELLTMATSPPTQAPIDEEIFGTVPTEDPINYNEIDDNDPGLTPEELEALEDQQAPMAREGLPPPGEEVIAPDGVDTIMNVGGKPVRIAGGASPRDEE